MKPEYHVEVECPGFGRKNRLAIWWPGGAIELRVIQLAEAEAVPYLEFDSKSQLEEFLTAFVNLAERLGLLKNVGELKGELRATKYHLEDMRFLAKMPEWER